MILCIIVTICCFCLVVYEATAYEIFDMNQIINCTSDFYFNNVTLRNFSYHGTKEYLKVGATVFCMNENLEGVEEGTINEIVVHNSCINLTEFSILPQTDCIPEIPQSILINSELDDNISNVVTQSNIEIKLELARAVIVEPRNHIALPYVIDNICNILKVPITLFHGINNKELANQLLTRNGSFIDQLIDLQVDNLDSDSYNELLLSEELFWSNIHTNKNDNVLIFQTDSGICNDDNTLINIELFRNYHYCGGLFHDLHILNTTMVGNGGFSIRNKDMMIKLLHMNSDHRHHFYWEDILYSYWCIKEPTCMICPEDIGQLLSETGTKFTNPIKYQLNNDYITLHKQNLIIDNHQHNDNYDNNNQIVSKIYHTTSLGFHNNWVWNNKFNHQNCSNIDLSFLQIDNKYFIDYFNQDLFICPFNILIMKLNLLNYCGYIMKFVPKMNFIIVL